MEVVVAGSARHGEYRKRAVAKSGLLTKKFPFYPQNPDQLVPQVLARLHFAVYESRVEAEGLNGRQAVW